MPDLPTVSEAFEADIGPFISAIHDARDAMLEAAAAAKTLQEMINSLHGKTLDIGVDTAGFQTAAAAAENLATNAYDAADAQARLTDTQKQLMDETVQVGARIDGLGSAYRQALISNVEFDLATVKTSQDLDLAWAAAQRMNIGMTDSRAAMDAAAAAAGAAAGGWRIFGVAAGTVLHWVVAAGAEFLAVAIPAAVALGAAMFVAAQGAQMVQQHMSALYTATEATANMFHTTIGSALGLHSALQQAQNTANPIVWSVLGGAINILKGNFQDLAGVGLQVMRIFQTFTARVVADFQAGFGQQIHGLLAGMVTDLTSFGQILGNVGHALLNFAAAMPGLAAVLLGLVTAVSHILLWFSQLPPILITVAMAMEEIWRWGGPLVAILDRIPVLLSGLVASGLGVGAVLGRVGQIFQSLALIVPRLGVALATGLISLSEWIPALGEAGVALGTFSEGVVAAIAGMSALGAGIAGVAVGGMAFLIYQALTAKSAAQQLADSMQHTVDVAKGMAVFSDTAANIGVLNGKLAESASLTQRASDANKAYVVGGRQLASIQAEAATNTATYSAAVKQQQQDMINASQAVNFLTHTYGVSFVGALELGTQAGVQWDQGIGRQSVAADINRLKVLDLMAGYKAMGQTAGAVGADMTAIAIQSGLQASKIQQLTQAWQSYMGLLTGGTNSLATFEQGLQNIGTVAASSAGSLFQATGKMNASTQQFAASLQSFTGKGAQNWQNFNQVVTTGAEGFINWMQTAGAAGVVSGGQMSGAIKGVVAQLIPFATHSQAARAELAGLAAQTGDVVAPTTAALEAWAKGGMNAQQLGKFVQATTVALSDMGKVAQNLGDVMQNDLVAMFDKAKLAASGLPGALSQLSTAMHTNGTSATTMQGDILNVIQRLLTLHTSLPTISALLSSMGVNLSAAGVQALIASGKLQAAGSSASVASGSMHNAASAASALAAALSQLHSINLTVTTSYITEGAPGLGGTGFRRVPVHASGTEAAAAGLALVGERGPELVMFGGGERVLNNADSQRFLNSPAAFPGGGGGGGGGYNGTINLTHTTHVHAQVDQTTLFDAVKTETARYAVRNGNPQQGRLAPGKL